MFLNDIPKDHTQNFPTGVSERNFDTEAEIHAFLEGLTYADDGDVGHGEVFKRDGKFVVRVRVGEWDEDDS